MAKDESGRWRVSGDRSRHRAGAGTGEGINVDHADLYFEYCQSESVSMEEGIVKRATKSVGRASGCGRRPVRKPALPIPMS